MVPCVRLLRDSRRVRSLRAALSSPAVLRTAVLAGLSGIAWLAGAAAAHADPVASASDVSAPSRLTVVAAPVIEFVADVPEPAALAPVNQLESVTSSVLAVPTELLAGSPMSDRVQATPAADASTDASAIDITHHVSSDRTTEAPGIGGFMTRQNFPSSTSASPFGSMMGHLAMITTGVGDTFGSVTGPVPGLTGSVDLLFTGLLPSGPPLSGATHRAVASPAIATTGDVAPIARPQPSVTHDSAESSPPAVSTAPSGFGAAWVHATSSWHSDPAPQPVPMGTEPGPRTGVVSTGVSPLGSTLIDGGLGSVLSTHIDRDAEVSRVAPATAVVGQLPDHVADPAVAPD